MVKGGGPSQPDFATLGRDGGSVATYSIDRNSAVQRRRPSSSTTLMDRRLDSSKRLAHHLDADRRIEAGGQFLPWAAHPPRLGAEGFSSGSQRVPLLTVMKVDSGSMLS